MKSVWHLTASALTVVSLNVLAAQSDWGLVRTTYTAGASKLVAKDQGSLEVNLQLKCVEKASVPGEISKIVDRINQEVKRESAYSLTTLNPDTSYSSQNQYEMKYRTNDVQQLNPAFVDVCSGKPANVGNSAVNLTKKFFTASATLKIQTQSSLSGLTILRQKLQQFAEDLNKEDSKKQVSIGTESFTVSAKKRKDVVSGLNDQSRLVSNSTADTRMKLDEALAGGFSQLFITSVTSEEDRTPDYAGYTPVLSENGQAKVTVPYVFSVQYSPSNIARKEHGRYPSQDRGELSQEINGEVVVDTDYYVAKLNFTTVCQPTKKDAMESTVAPFNKFRVLANAIVKLSANNPYERLEVNIGTPIADGQWQPWEREILNSTQSISRGESIAVKSYISLCDGHIVSELKEQDSTYTSLNTITLVTKNFAGLKALADAANTFTQEQRNTDSPKHVEVQLGSISPKLKDARLFEVVDVLAYRVALRQFVDPQGEMAKKLLDEIRADEAYYTASRGYGYTKANRGAPAAAAPGGARAASFGSADESSYNVIATSDGSIPPSEIRLKNTYSVVFRPNKNLVQILKEARNSANGVKVPARQ